MKNINKNSDIPLYLQLAQIIRDDIESGVIKPGEKLPSEPELIKKFGVARMTIRNALSELVNEGLIEKHHGKGSFCKSSFSKKNIDVLLDMSDHYFLPYNLQSICTVLEENGCNLIAGDTKNSNTEIVKLINLIAKRDSDGVIIQGSPASDLNEDEFTSALNKLKIKNIPCIIIDYQYNFNGVCYAVMDEECIGRLAAAHLKNMGHINTAAILIENDGLAKKRYKGFSEVMPEASIIYFNDSVKMHILEQISNGVSAFFCFNDTIAQKLIDLLKEENLSVPEDVSIISVDDTIIAAAYNITSVAHAKKLMGKYAANKIISGNPENKTFTPSVTERNSVKNLNITES